MEREIGRERRVIDGERYREREERMIDGERESHLYIAVFVFLPLHPSFS